MTEQKDLTPQALIAERQRALGVDDEALAFAVGYKPGVIAMIKAGRMRLPINKVPTFAQALQMEPVSLLRSAVVQASPELLSVLEPLLPLGQLAPGEVNLLQHLRKLAAGRPLAPVVLDGAGVVALVVT